MKLKTLLNEMGIITEMPHIFGDKWHADLRIELYYKEFDNVDEGQEYAKKLMQNIYKKDYCIIPVTSDKLFLKLHFHDEKKNVIYTKDQIKNDLDVLLPKWWEKYAQNEGLIAYINQLIFDYYDDDEG